MALSLGELVAMAQARENMKDSTDRWQKGVNDVSYGIGSILGYIYGGKALGGMSNLGQMGGQMGGSDAVYTGDTIDTIIPKRKPTL